MQRWWEDMLAVYEVTGIPQMFEPTMYLRETPYGIEQRWRHCAECDPPVEDVWVRLPTVS